MNILDWIFGPKKQNTSIVVQAEGSTLPITTYGDYYSVEVCPSCYHILDHDKARYKTKCCYLCGYSNCGVLFDTKKVIVRDVYTDGKYRETVCKTNNKKVTK